MRRRGESVDEWRDRMMERAEQQRYFARPVTPDGRAVDAAFGQNRTPVRKPTPAPKPPREPKPPRVRVPKPPPAPKTPRRPKDCTVCRRPMRPARSSLADHPGTVPHQAKGVCTSCTRRGDGTPASAENRVRTTMPEKCKECGWNLRLRSAAPTSDTRRYAGKGLCATCQTRKWYQAHRAAK